jgi:cold shock CspA family protein
MPLADREKTAMMLPLQITFRNVESSAETRDWIEAEVAKLESFYHRIISCHVTLEMFHARRRQGSPYHVRIDLAVPGAEIVIKRDPSLGVRVRQEEGEAVPKKMQIGAPHKDLRQAIDDAFNAASRRLLYYARRQRGGVKLREHPSRGLVSTLVPGEGFGFLTAEDGREIYFQSRSVLHGAFPRLKLGTPVIYAEERGEKGPQASTVRLAGKSKRPPAVAAG